MKRSIISLLFVALLAATPPAEAQGDAMAVAEKLNVAYTAAFNKGDARALAAMYAEDAEYTDVAGERVTGRAAVEESLKKTFAAKKGLQLEATIESARYLTPDVLLEKGISRTNDLTTRYVCNYVRKDGNWLISELSEITQPPVDAAAEALADLSWLAGTWKDNTPGMDVSTEVAWTKNGHFLRRSFTVRRENEDAVEGTEIIGYDPVTNQIRSWLFDSEGGFGEGRWRRENDKWLVTAHATSPEGRTSTAQHVLTEVDGQKFNWESINRQADGEALPNLEKVEVVRTAGPASGSNTDRR
jgi:uncharacterized protein (TIGR02246 family)